MHGMLRRSLLDARLHELFELPDWPLSAVDGLVDLSELPDGPISAFVGLVKLRELCAWLVFGVDRC